MHSLLRSSLTAKMQFFILGQNIVRFAALPQREGMPAPVTIYSHRKLSVGLILYPTSCAAHLEKKSIRSQHLSTHRCRSIGA